MSWASSRPCAIISAAEVEGGSMDDHSDVLARVDALVAHARMLRADAGETGTPVTPNGLSTIVRGALIALEKGNAEIAKQLLAGYLAMSAEISFVAPNTGRVNVSSPSALRTKYEALRRRTKSEIRRTQASYEARRTSYGETDDGRRARTPCPYFGMRDSSLPRSATWRREIRHTGCVPLSELPLSTHTRRMRFSGPLTGVLCKRPFPEFVAKIRIQRQRSSADIYRACEQNCNRPVAFKNATVRERPGAVLLRSR
jgi:hypothetical protein